MSLISKISHLRKLPELLNQKEKAKKRSKKDQEEEKEHKQDQPSFSVEDDVSIDPDKLSEYKVKHTKKPDSHRKAQTDDENIGQNVDLTV